MARQASGIEIGSRTVKAVRGGFKGSTFHVTGFALGEVTGGGTVERWAGLPQEFKLGASRVALSGKDVNIRYTRVPRVPDWQLRKLMRFEVAEIGESSGEGVASDFNLLPELPESGGEDIVLLAMARENLLQEHLDGAKEMGAQVESFAPSAVALYNAWLRFGVVQDDTVLVADIGHDNMDVAIVRGPDLLFARNLSGGGDLFDQAIATQLGVKPGQANELKLEHADLRPGARAKTPNGERVQRAIQGAGGQILSLLQSAILFCKTQIKVGGLKIDRVQICGGAAGLQGLGEYLSRGMSVPVGLFDPLDALDLSALDPDQAAQLEEYRLEAVTSLGLAVMGSDPDAYSLEILPQAVVAKREFWGKKMFLIAAGVMAVGYLGWYASHIKGRIAEGETEARSLVSKVRRAKAADSQARQYIIENKQLAETSQELLWSLGGGRQAEQVMDFLAIGMPDDFWVSQIEVSRAFDDELGLGRDGGQRPVLKIKGKARDSAVSPTVQHNSMITALQESFPGARLNHSVDRSNFKVDLTFFADAPVLDPELDSTEGQ